MVCITRHEAELKRKHIQGIVHLIPKINSAIEIIKLALQHHNYPIITFSGGKDSLVVLDIVRQIRPETKGLFANTGNEYTETIPYVRGFENIIEVEPKKSFWACVKEYGLPENKRTGKRHGNACCFWLKESPLKSWQKDNNIDLIFTGLTSSESRQRMMTIKRMINLNKGTINEGKPIYFHKKEKMWRCHPIHDWTEQDVWDYITLKNLPYNPIYDMGIPRCGCRFCTAYLSWKDITSLYNEKDTHILAKKQGYKLLNEF